MPPGGATPKMRVPSTTPIPSKGHHPEPRRACPKQGLYNVRQSRIGSPRPTSVSQHEDRGGVSLETDKSGPREPLQYQDCPEVKAEKQQRQKRVRQERERGA